LKLLCLDIDGVCNNQQHISDNHGAKIGGVRQLSPVLCERVQRICTATGAQILLTSTWRLSTKRPRMQAMLAARGLTARIVGYTPQILTRVDAIGYDEANRGVEIHRWLTQAPRGITGIVVIDDDPGACLDANDDPFLYPWYVRTYFHSGITEEDVPKAIMMLNKPAPEWLTPV